MAELHHALASRVAAWRAAGYPCEAAPAIAEILGYAVEGEDPAAPFPQSGQLRFLRAAQLRALETYWYLRLVEGTPRIGDLYDRVEVKMTARRADLVEGAAGVKAVALQDLADRNPGRVFYRMVFADSVVSQEDVEYVRGYLDG